jgi:hypothetical protein
VTVDPASSSTFTEVAAMTDPGVPPPSLAEPASVLAANADRERAIDVLKAGFAEGRLSYAEYGDLMTRVYAARTLGELAELVADLPAGPLGAPAQYPAAGNQSQQPVTDSMAIAALACGIGGFFTMGLTAIPAVVLGHAARRRVRQTGQRGDGLALAGLILGWAGIGLIVAVIAVLIITAATGHVDVSHPTPGALGALRAGD